MRRSNALCKILSIFVVVSMIVGGMSLPWAGLTQDTYAKERGQKNKQACDNCNAVKAGTAPEGYTGVEGTKVGDSTNYSVYSGGNSYSKADKVEFDKDTTDFANPLPYGNVYVDASKLNWNDPKGFIIDIKDKERFKWVSVTDEPLKDAKGNESTNDPMGLDPAKPLKMTSENPMKGICYVGPLESYLSDVTSQAKAPDTTTKSNVITPKAGDPYLYRITYLDAVTLPNGTKGNLILTMNRVEIETSVTVNESNPYKPSGANYSYTKALIKVQGENQLSNDTGYNLTDADGKDVNQRITQIMSKDEATSLMGSINALLPDGEKMPSDWEQAKNIRNATGSILDLDIEVKDSEGNPVEGTISYAAHDMDFESAQNVWGRPVGDEFSEGMMIVSGALSYALVPDYAKIVKGQKVFYKDADDATTRGTGWAPVGPEQDQLDRVLDIKRVAEGSNANGVRFASPFLVNYRDADGDFSDVIFNNPEVASLQGDGLSANNNIILYKNGSNPITELAQKQIYAKLKPADRPDSWKNVTAEMAWSKLGPYSWKTSRNDNDASFDSGFAVLLDSKKSSLRWTGSRAMGANLNTTLFDPTLYTYIEQTHGTGGGIYLESYNVSSNCDPTPMEGVVTMGRDSNATVTTVPEDGYRVKTIKVGGVGLKDPVTYTMIYGADGKITGIESNGTTTPISNKKATINGIEFEANDDGSVDVSAIITNPRHFHVDFTSDYYFYKVWKIPEGSSVDIPETLELTATPSVFKMTSVTVGGVTYSISDEGTTYTAPNGKKHYMTANSTIVLGEGDAAKTYTLVGDKLVDSAGNEYQIATSTEQGNTKTFTVSSTGSDVDDGFVSVETDSDGNTVWKVRYPEEGRDEATSGKWPALPIETYERSDHNYNHVQRNYWFVAETVPPAWTENYDNSTALTPGIVTAEDGEGTLWKEQATIYHDPAEDLIASKDDSNFAFMSPLSTAVTHNDTTYTGWGGEIANEITPPEGTPKETYGAKNEPQYADGKSMFNVTTEKAQDGSDNEIVKVELIGNDGKPATSVKVKGGTYTVDKDGMITFTPDKDFVGDPPPVTVRGTDKNGLSAETTYTPHVRDVIKTVTRTIVYEYEDGTPVMDGDGKPLTVEQTVEFAGTINPDTGEIVYPSDAKGTMEEVPSNEIDYYNVDRETVGKAVVYPDSDDLFEKVIYSPVGIKPTADVTYGLPNEPQKGIPKFEMEDGTPGEITVKLIDPHTGKPVDDKTVDAVDKDGKKVGTYTLNEDGTVTFTPNKDYVGNPMPLELEGTAPNGKKKAKTTYTPHIVDPVNQDTATRTIHYTYLTKDGKKATGDITQTAVLHRHAKSVDPKTGEVLEWGDWEPATFPAVKNPDDKVNGKIWYTDDSAGEQTVTKPGRVPDVHIVYQKFPYTVKYLNGLHGKSNGKGNQSGVPYADMVKGGNSVTPASGYKFTGKYTYVIRDRDGKIIKTGETDDPTSVEVIGNIEFTPIYKKLPTAIYVDPATGRTIQQTLPFSDDNTEPAPPADPKRDGYKFVGWNRIMEYDENGELVNVRYEAKWEKIEDVAEVPSDEPADEAGDKSIGTEDVEGANTGDDSFILINVVILILAVLATVLMLRRRRKYTR